MSQHLPTDRIYGHPHYTALYDLELANFSEDLAFYRRYLPASPCAILELGCGTGRVSRALATDGHRLTGIDLSLPMLAAASSTATAVAPRYACMDMTALAFRTTFAAIIAPYNTLNLLNKPEDLHACLAEVHRLLDDDGIFLLQLYVPDAEFRALEGKKQFQYQIFNRPDGSKIIKEITKSMSQNSGLIKIMERYYLRFSKEDPNEEWLYTYRILGYEYAVWKKIFADHGFQVDSAYGNYNLAPFVHDKHTTLLLALKLSRAGCPLKRNLMLL